MKRQLKRFIAVFSVLACLLTILPASPMNVFADELNPNLAQYEKTYDGNVLEIPQLGDLVKGSIVAQVDNADINRYLSSAIKAAINTVDFSSISLAELAAGKSVAGFTIQLMGHDQKAASTSPYTANISVIFGQGFLSYDFGVFPLYQYTINPKPLQVVVSDMEIQAGSAIPQDSFYNFTVQSGIAGESITYTGVPTFTTTYTESSVEGEIETISISSVGSLDTSNSNYTFTGADLSSQANLTVTKAANFVKEVTLTQAPNLTYQATDVTAQVKAQFISDMKSMIIASYPEFATIFSAVSDEVLASLIVVNQSGNVRDAQTYELAMDLTSQITGMPNVGDYDSYSFHVKQALNVEKYSGIQIYINNKVGDVVTNSTNYKIIKASELNQAEADLLDYYVVIDDANVDDAIVNELNQGSFELSVTNTTNIIGLFKESTVGANFTSSASSNYEFTVHTGKYYSGDLIDDLIAGVENELGNAISQFIDIPVDLGSLNKKYDGNAFANVDEETMNEFSNEALDSLMGVLDNLQGGLSSTNLPDEISIPSIPGSIDIAGVNVELEGEVADQINQVIQQINGALTTVNQGFDTAQSFIDYLEGLGNGDISIRVEEIGAGLANTIEVSDKTTLDVYVDITLVMNAADLLENIDLDDSIKNIISKFFDYDVTLTIPLHVATADFGVDPLPVTIYYSEEVNNSEFVNNAGVFDMIDPAIIEAQFTNDHYVVVNPLYYYFLSDEVKAALSADVLDTISQSTLNENYEVTILKMSEDTIFGALVEDIKDGLDFIEGEIDKVKEEIEKLDQLLTDVKDLTKEELEQLLGQLEDLYEKLEDLENAVDEKIDDLLEKADQMIDRLEPVLGEAFEDINDIKQAIEDLLDGKFNDIIRDQFKNKLDQLKEKLEAVLDEAISDALENLGLDEKLSDLLEQFETDINGFMDSVNNQLPLVSDLGGLSKQYDGTSFDVNDDEIIQNLIDATALLKNEVDQYQITALSQVDLGEWLVSTIPSDVISAYNKSKEILARLGIEMQSVEDYVALLVSESNTAKNEVESFLNGELDKVVEEIQAVETCLTQVNDLSLSELQAEVEKLNNQYVRVVFEGNTAVEDAPGSDLVIRVYTKLFNQETEVLTMSYSLEITPVELQIEVMDQTLKAGEQLNGSLFTILTTVDPSISQEAIDSIELFEENGKILARVKQGVTNFTVVVSKVGNLEQVSEPVTTPTTPTNSQAPTNAPTEQPQVTTSTTSGGASTTTSTTTTTTTTVEESESQTSAETTQVTTAISEEATPEVAQSTSGWALMNVILALVGVAFAILGASKARSNSTNVVLALVPTAVAIIALALTQSFTGKMQMLDSFTSLFAATCVIQVVLYVMFARQENEISE